MLEPYLKTSSVKDCRTTKLEGQVDEQRPDLSALSPLASLFWRAKTFHRAFSEKKKKKKICLASVGDGAYHFKLRGNVVSSAETLA